MTEDARKLLDRLHAAWVRILESDEPFPHRISWHPVGIIQIDYIHGSNGIYSIVHHVTPPDLRAKLAEADDLIETVARNVAAGHGEEDMWRAYVLPARCYLLAAEAAGYRIVPVEPTEKMIEDGAYASGEDCPFLARRTYSAMLAAAPKVVP